MRRLVVLAGLMAAGCGGDGIEPGASVLILDPGGGSEVEVHETIGRDSYRVDAGTRAIVLDVLPPDPLAGEPVKVRIAEGPHEDDVVTLGREALRVTDPAR